VCQASLELQHSTGDLVSQASLPALCSNRGGMTIAAEETSARFAVYLLAAGGGGGCDDLFTTMMLLDCAGCGGTAGVAGAEARHE
jgi:hypothetical protein